ncbi:hypothetical protein [Nocardia sp. CA-290969]|uniref:hypothetical protein n=1 Tax=Nocardia sp. CA-290969 TaxID=3239986 RepID=UPI003D90CD33
MKPAVTLGIPDGSSMVELSGIGDRGISATPEATITIIFEPLSGEFDLTDGDIIDLRIPRHLSELLKYVVWPNGLSVWLNYGKDEKGEFIILDRNKVEIDRF